MDRSSFLKKLLGSIAIGKLPVSVTRDFRKIYLLQCFVAGFRHYEGMQLLGQMKPGDLLELVRDLRMPMTPVPSRCTGRGEKSALFRRKPMKC